MALRLEKQIKLFSVGEEASVFERNGSYFSVWIEHSIIASVMLGNF